MAATRLCIPKDPHRSYGAGRASTVTVAVRSTTGGVSVVLLAKTDVPKPELAGASQPLRRRFGTCAPRTACVIANVFPLSDLPPSWVGKRVSRTVN